MRKNLLAVLLTVSFLAATLVSRSQCIQLIHYPADTMGWTHGYSESYGKPYFIGDSLTLNTNTGGENSYYYDALPVTLFGPGSAFSASYDFCVDSLAGCSDGLSFWFFTSDLAGLGSSGKEGGQLGFPDTVNGFTLSFELIGCTDHIYMKKINSTNYSWSGGSGHDTNIATPLTSTESFLTDGHWHHVTVDYEFGNFTTSFDGGRVVMSGYSPIYGTGHFGFMATNGGGRSRKRIKNIQICAGFGAPTAGNDSFGCYLTRQCNGPELTALTGTYNATNYVITNFGDGTINSAGTLPDISGGYAITNHAYQAPGNYSIRQTLYRAGTALDSIKVSYQNVFCTSLPVKFYYDANGDCLMDGSESFVAIPMLTEVDSNGIAIDTISAISGFYYNANGNIGDVYSFRVISVPGNMYVSCPAGGVLTYTLTAGVFINPIQYVAVNCDSGSNFDLAINAVVPVTGVRDEWGDIYVTNAWCAPVDATITVNFSPKYVFTGDAYPAPASYTGSTLTWNISSLSNQLSGPAHIHYQVDNPSSGPLTPRDTVNTSYNVNPWLGDVDTQNNHCHITDTVKSGCDPNEMSVKPAGIIPPTVVTALQYIINFENTGNDTAFNIYVMDTLSDNVDVNSMRLVTASAQMNIVKLRSGGHNIIKFDFPNINLVDSGTSQILCNGAVIFNINTMAGLPVGASVFNHAGIFFDYNAVVMTDTVQNNVAIPVNLTLAALPGETVCNGTAVSYSVTGGTAPYQWLVNGGLVGGASTSSYTYTPADGDSIRCVVPASDFTPGGSSNTINMIVTPLTTPTLSLAALPGYSVCSGTAVSYLVTGGTPPYQWLVNGSTISGATGISYIYSPADGDSIRCVVFGRGCNLGGSSNSVAMAVIPTPTTTPTLSMIAEDMDTVCSGIAVTFSVSSSNGGPSPMYNWNLYGVPTGATTATFSLIPIFGDVVSCTMISDALCGPHDTLTTTPVTIFVAPAATPVTTIVSYPAFAPVDVVTYAGELVTFNASVVYGGTDPTYQWYDNEAAIPGATTSGFSKNVNTADTVYCVVHSNYLCATTTTDTSNAYMLSTNTLSVRYLTTISDLSLYPDPNNGNFILSGKFKDAGSNTLELEVLNMLGKSVYTGSVILVNRIINEPIILGNEIANGNYFLKISAGGETQVMQFAVIR